MKRAFSRVAPPEGANVAFALMMSQYDVEPAGLAEVLQRSDIVSMHAPATPDAHHLLTDEHFRMMKPSAIFINTGRGPTVDEAALIKAFQEGCGSPPPGSTCSSRSRSTPATRCSRWRT
jgi:hypothetical protein